MLNLRSNPSPTVSDKFAFLSTPKIIQFFKGKDIDVVKTVLTGLQVRAKERQGYQKHFVLFNLPDQFRIPDRGDFVTPQILLINSYEGTSSLKLLLALNVGICSNGIVTCDKMLHTIRIKHIGDAKQQLIAALDEMLIAAGNLTDQIKLFKNTELPIHKYVAFARKAGLFRLGDITDKDEFLQAEHQDLLTYHRPEDNGSDLWTVFNRIQENVIRGGMKYQVWRTNKVGEKVLSQRKTRPLKSMDSRIKANQFLWQQLQSYSEVA